jgi:hypothetical protein
MKKIVLYIVTTIFLISCEGRLELDNPNDISDASFWKTEDHFMQALTSAYAPLRNFNSGYYSTRGIQMRNIRADDVTLRNDVYAMYQIYTFQNDGDNTWIAQMFRQCYSGIYRVNSIMQEIEEKPFSNEFVSSILGDAYFLRGLYNFILAKEFGSVPLRLKASQFRDDYLLEKSPIEAVYTQAENDFRKAAEYLPQKAVAPERPSKAAAIAFLGKVQVYQEKWTDAKNTLIALTQSPYSFGLVQDYTWNFDEEHEYNSESIFEISHTNVGGNSMWSDESSSTLMSHAAAKEFAPAEVDGWYESDVTRYILDYFLEEQDTDGNTDIRVIKSVAWDYEGCIFYLKPFREALNNVEISINRVWMQKYSHSFVWDSELIAESFINERAFRYVDVLLLLAEAQLNSDEPGKAIDNLNIVRTRANLKLLDKGISNTAIKNDIIRQRAIEFLREGERFYDLRRWGMLDEAIAAVSESRSANFRNGDFYYFPIPNSELQTNTLCTPNKNGR